MMRYSPAAASALTAFLDFVQPAELCSLLNCRIRPCACASSRPTFGCLGECLALVASLRWQGATQVHFRWCAPCQLFIGLRLPGSQDGMLGEPDVAAEGEGLDLALGAKKKKKKKSRVSHCLVVELCAARFGGVRSTAFDIFLELATGVYIGKGSQLLPSRQAQTQNVHGAKTRCARSVCSAGAVLTESDSRW